MDRAYNSSSNHGQRYRSDHTRSAEPDPLGCGRPTRTSEGLFSELGGLGTVWTIRYLHVRSVCLSIR